jgi:hypothetical protein
MVSSLSKPSMLLGWITFQMSERHTHTDTDTDTDTDTHSLL